MSNIKNIIYGIDLDTGQIVSRCDQDVALPVLDFEGMTPETHFEMKYGMEKHNIYDVLPHMNVQWTRKIPNAIKNIHRQFHGMKPLKGKNRWEN